MDKIEPPSGFFGKIRNTTTTVPQTNNSLNINQQNIGSSLTSSIHISEPIEIDEVKTLQQKTQQSKENSKSAKFSFGKLGAGSKTKKVSIAFNEDENVDINLSITKEFSQDKAKVLDDEFRSVDLQIQNESINSTTNNEVLFDEINSQQNLSKEDPGFDKTKRIKIEYLYDTQKKPKLDEKTKKAINWGDMIRQNEEKKKHEQKITQAEIDRRNAEEGAFDLFQGISVEKNEEKNEDDDSFIVKKIKDALTVLENNVSVKKGSTQARSTISIDTFISNLVTLLDFMNPEERGRILNICIFGCLISRAKINGAGGKPALSKFPALINAFKGYKTGGSSNANGKVYLQVREILTSSKLNSYRVDSTAPEQVTKVTELITKVVASKKEIYFPTETLSDPIPVLIGDSKIPNVRSVGIIGLPTLENMNSFFAPVLSKTKPTSGKTNNSGKSMDDYNDSGDDAEENLSKRFHQRGADDWMISKNKSM